MFKFKIDQRNQEVQLKFLKKATVATARATVAAKLGVDPGTVTLLFTGNSLQDKFIIDRLRIGNDTITVYIKDNTEVLLLTGKGYRRH
jgi:hypothetical protein